MTSSILHYVIILAISFCIHKIIQSIKWRNEEVKDVTTPISPQHTQQKFDVEGELLATLREMNCIPESIPCGNGADIQFTYQGENLLIRTDEDYRIVKIVDPYWFGGNQDDIDKFSEVRKAINQVNKDLIGTTLFYNIDERDKQFHVSSIDRIIVANDTEETKRSIESAIGGFFQAHRCFERELIKQNIQ